MLKKIKYVIPNIFTGSRAFVFLPLMIFNAINGNIPLVLTFFGVGALTDMLDGFLARKLDAVTEFGKKFDPVVDTWFGTGSLIVATLLMPVMAIPLAFEFVKTCVGAYVILKNKEVFSVSMEGKRKTVILGLTTFIGLAAALNPAIVNMLLPAVAITSILQVRTMKGYAQLIGNNVTKEESLKLSDGIQDNLNVEEGRPLLNKWKILRREVKSIQESIHQNLDSTELKGNSRKLKK